MTKISDAIKHDHQELRDAHQHIMDASTPDSKIRWRNQFTWELARHSIGEELVLYPAFEKYLDDGKAMADKDRKQHAKVKEYLYKIQEMDPANSEFDPTLRSLWTDLRTHMEEEERDDLPAIEGKLAQGASEQMAKSFGRTKMFVPSRSHPAAPDKPPFETVVGLMAAPIDHLMDLFKKFPKESESQMPP